MKTFINKKNKDNILSFLTCGNVDNGKSTLIGRLLYDTKQIYEDQLSILNNKNLTKKNNKLNLSSLIDGLESELVQGITIDVSYRYFTTQKRKFIVVDSPGHEQYTRNMVSGASNCDLAIILIDACKGVLHQTKRHSFINILLGIRHFIIAINKMDLVNYEEGIFNIIKKVYLNFIKNFSVNLNIKFVPLSALYGENVIKTTKNMPWYKDLTLIEILEGIEISNFQKNKSLRFPIQYVNHSPKLDFLGYSGNLTSGKLYVGQKIKVLTSGLVSNIKHIVTFDGNLIEANAGDAITAILSDNIDINRGDLLVDYNEELLISCCAQVYVVWMSQKALMIGQSFNIKIANKTINGQIKKINYQINTNNLTKLITTSNIPFNGIGLIELFFDEKIVLDEYNDYKITGSMIFIDKTTNNTVGAGMIYNNFVNKNKIEQINN